MAEVKKRRRPAPLQLLRLDDRDDSSDSDSLASLAQRATPSPSARNSFTPGFPSILQPSIIPLSPTRRPSEPALLQTSLATVSSRGTQSVFPSTSQRPSTPRFRLSTTSTATTTITAQQSPTKTTFIVVTQSLKSPKEKAETPGEPKTPARTIFISGTPQILTVTVAPTTTAPLGVTEGAPKKSQVQSVLPPGAVAPVIILGVLGELHADMR